jgi:carboxylesterase
LLYFKAAIEKGEKHVNHYQSSEEKIFGTAPLQIAKAPIGLLILHGFTGSLQTVQSIAELAKSLDLPFKMPVLRGHGTRWEDLKGVEANDWFLDAEKAFFDLLIVAEKVVIVGLSMGGVVTLNLARHHKERLVAQVLIAPALRFKDPLVNLTPLLTLLTEKWPKETSIKDPELAKKDTNYKFFPPKTFNSLLRYNSYTEQHLNQVTVPTLLIYAKQDQVVHPVVAKILTENLASTDIQVKRLENCGHEILLDTEAETAVGCIRDYLVKHCGVKDV